MHAPTTKKKREQSMCTASVSFCRCVFVAHIIFAPDEGKFEAVDMQETPLFQHTHVAVVVDGTLRPRHFYC